MKALSLSLCLFLFAVIFGSAAGCRVDFPDDLPYTCESDADCGGNNYVCASLPDARRYCCLPEPETCNRIDDDCDGTVDEAGDEPCYEGPEGTADVGLCRAGQPTCGTGNIVCSGQVLPATETCNTLDDDCDGTVDDGFDLQTDRAHCGRCNNPCTATQDCIAGTCQGRREAACNDTQDNDTDGAPDCADSDCDGQACGEKCVCIGGQKGEGDCTDGVTNDDDTDADCADADCNAKACGDKCLCIGGKKGEGDCTDNVTNDDDALVDCADTDCELKECSATGGCTCKTGNKTEAKCDDGVSNDGDAQVDCADSDCGGQSCGLGCQCASSRKTEVTCSDGLDNDGDTLKDCEDPDCDAAGCFAGDLAGTVCRRRQCMERNCNDTLDNDGNGKTDCQDPNCEGNFFATGRVCTVTGPQEGGGTACNDNADNDNNSKIDCRTNVFEQNCLNGVCGFGCKYNNTVGNNTCNNPRIELFCDDGIDNDGNGGTDCADSADCNGKSCNFLGGCTCASPNKKETLCADTLDNDGDNLADCADNVDCPSGTACKKADGTAGTCQSNRTCGP